VAGDISAALSDQGLTATVDSASLIVQVEALSSGPSVGVLVTIIVGGIAGGAALIGLIVLLVFLCTKKRTVEPEAADLEEQTFHPLKASYSLKTWPVKVKVEQLSPQREKADDGAVSGETQALLLMPLTGLACFRASLVASHLVSKVSHPPTTNH
jgi:hypothetical protein